MRFVLYELHILKKLCWFCGLAVYLLFVCFVFPTSSFGGSFLEQRLLKALESKSEVTDTKERCVDSKGYRICAAKFFDAGFKLSKRGDILFNTKNVSVINKDSTVKIVIANAVFRVNVSSLLKFNFIPKIEKISGVKVLVESKQKYNNGNLLTYEEKIGNALVVQSTIKKTLAFLEKFLIQAFGFSSYIPSTRCNVMVAEDIEILVNGDSASILNAITIPQIWLEPVDYKKVRPITKGGWFSRAMIMEASKRDFNRQTKIFGVSIVNHESVPFEVYCQEKRFGNKCGVKVKNMSLVGLNSIFVNYGSDPMVPILNFKEFRGDVEFLFGTSIEKAGNADDNNILLFSAITEDTRRLFFGNGDYVLIEPTKVYGALNIATMNLELYKNKYIIDGSIKLNLHLLVNMLAKQGEELMKVKFDVSSASEDYFWRVMRVVALINKNLQVLYNNISANITTFNGFSIVESGEVLLSRLGSPRVKIFAKVEDLAGEIIALNKLVISNAKANILVDHHETKLEIKGASIGETNVEKIDLVFIHPFSKDSFSSNKPTTQLKIAFNLVEQDFTKIFTNPAMSASIKRIVEVIGVEEGATVSGGANMLINLTSPIQTIGGFSLIGKANITNFKTTFGQALDKPVLIEVNNKLNSPHLEMKATFEDAKLYIGNTLLQDNGESLVINAEWRDFLYSEASLTGAPEASQREAYLDELGNARIKWIYLDRITAIGGVNKEVLLDGRLSFDREDTLESTSISAEFIKVKLLGNDINKLLFTKKPGSYYRFDIDANSIDYTKLRDVWLHYIPNSKGNTDFGEFDVNGSCISKQVKFMNGVVGDGFILNVNIRNGIISSANLSFGMERTMSAPSVTQIINAIKEIGQLSGSDRTKISYKFSKLQQKYPSLFSGGSTTEKEIERLTYGDSILISIDKSKNKNKVYGSITNLRMIMDAIGIRGVKSLGGGRVKIEGLQTASKGIQGKVLLNKMFYYPSGDFDGDLKSIDPKRIGVVESAFTNFNYNLHNKTLSLKDAIIRSNLLFIEAKGFLDFKKDEIYLDGILEVFGIVAEDFGLSNIPLFGSQIRTSGRKRGVLRFNFIVDSSLDNLEEADISLKASKRLFFLSMGLSGVVVVVTIGILLAVLL